MALQLGGSDPRELAPAARAGEQAGYDEINLNCGCPSDRVASGAFGACLMLEPTARGRVRRGDARCGRVPVTVKMRIGVVIGARARGSRGALRLRRGRLRRICGTLWPRCAQPAAGGDRARAQGRARRTVAEGEPRGAAAALRSGAAAQARVSRAARRRQRRPARLRGGGRGTQLVRRRDARPRGLSPAVRCSRSCSARWIPQVAPRRRARRCSSAWPYTPSGAGARATRLAAITRHMLGLYGGRARGARLPPDSQ